jgi:Tfp pilus assembly protein PilN
MDFLQEIDKQALRLLGRFTSSIAVFNNPEKVIVIEIKGTGKSSRTIKKKEYPHNIDSPAFWQEVNKDFDFKNKLVSTNLYTSAGLFKLVEAPKMDKEEIKDWLQENVSGFFKIPNILDQSILSYRIIDDSTDPFSMLVALINKEELDHILALFKEHSIALSAVSFHNMYFMPVGLPEDVLGMSYVTNKTFDEIILAGHSGLIYYNQFPASTNPNINEELVWDRLHQLEAQESHILGLIKENSEKTDFTLIEDSETKYEKLADYALLPHSQSIKILPEKETTQCDNLIWGRLFQRFAMALGALIVGLFLLQFLVSGITNLLIGHLAEETEILKPQLVEIDSLKTHYKSLNEEYRDVKRSRESRTNSHLILAGLATHIRGKLWLTSIEYDQNSDENYNTVITGYSLKRSSIAALISAIEKDVNFTDVKLGYIKKLSAKEFFKTWKINSSRYHEFRILFKY